MRHFWNWVKNEDNTRTLYLEGVIAEESWFADDITPAMFKEELFAGDGPITLHINSPGGDCIAASQIYTMLMDYPDDVIVQIDGMAASAASVIAMAGTRVCMSPTSMIMIHTLHSSIHTGKVKQRRGGGKQITIGVHHAEHGAYYANPVEFGHGGPAPAPAHPFVRPAFDTKADEAFSEIKRVLRDELKNR